MKEASDFESVDKNMDAESRMSDRYSMEGSGLTVGAVAAQTRHSLASRFGDGEAMAMVREIFERLKGFTAVDMVVKSDEEMTRYMVGKINDVAERVLADEPLQYVLGAARFYGMDFKVTPATLIPRPETAALVDIIVDQNAGSDLKVLDLGTGTGCIAIALARNLKFSKVTAVDISSEALSVARENAMRLNVSVDFVKADMMSFSEPAQKWDIIVSNPPYVLDSEKPMIEDNVLLHEPSTALFVPDDDGTRYYRGAARIASESLSRGGHVYFELNPLTAVDVRKLMVESGFSSVEILKDIEGRDRYMIASW